MSNFVVSARKYRPIRFDSVVGQQHVSQTLKNAIGNDHLAQAFLFCGPRGVGKTTTARILAKVLNCEQPTEDIEPCDECDACLAFRQNTSMNIYELDAASNNSVEHIRSLIEQVRFGPQRGRYKIYIIDEVHMLSQAAFNAFLKTLEEPPTHAIFILATTEKHKIIPTILSRCQIFDFNRIQVADMAAHLKGICEKEGIQAEEEALNIIAQKADGALRDALSIFDRIVSFSGNEVTYAATIENLNILDYSFYFRIVDALAMEDMAQLLLLFDEIMRKGFDGDVFINGLAEHLRDLLVCQDPQTAKLLEVSGQIQKRYFEQAQQVETALLLSALNLANECDVNYKMARNKRLHVEMTLIKMAHIMQAVRRSHLPQPEVVEVEKKKLKTETKEKLPQAQEEDNEVEEAEKKAQKAAQKKRLAEALAKKKQAQEQQEESTETPEKKTGSLLDSLAQEVEAKDKAAAERPKVELSLENLQKAWTVFTEKVSSNSARQIFKGAELALEAKNVVVIVGSEMGKNAILQEYDLGDFLREELQDGDLLIDVRIEKREEQLIEKPEEERKPETPREKFIYLRDKNPLLTEFQKTFQLYPGQKKK